MQRHHPVAAMTHSVHDLNNLLALMKKFQTQAEEERRYRTPSLDCTILATVLAEKLPAFDYRVTRVLDALALICVKQPKGEVFAVSAQVQHNSNPAIHKGKIVL